MKIELRKPIEFEGKNYESIDLNLAELTGSDILSAERMFTSSNPANSSNMAKEFTKEYNIHVAARAAKLPVELFMKLGAQDFTEVAINVQNFLIGVLAE